MSNTWLRGVVLAVPLAAIGCGSSETGSTSNLGGSNSGAGGSATTGGASGTSTSVSSSTGGNSQATGGATSGDTTATGGKATTGGNTSNGGSAATGGSKAGGGASATGGTKTGGGATATGGTKAGGGTSSNGGSAATGGAMSDTGGTKANGGSAATGGTKANGGSAATGGAAPVGGSAATGGTSTVSTEPTGFTSTNNSWKSAPVTTATSGTADVTVNDASAGQTWEGFGGAFNELGWKYLTSSTMQQDAIRLLFDAADGANFAWGRIPMGASDYAEIRYTLDDTADPNDPTPASGESNRPPADTSLSKFSLTRDGKYLIPYIKAALQKKPDLRFWASPWTPPVWMKTGLKTNSGADSSKPATKPSYFDGGNFVTNKTDYLNAYAEYYKKFLQGYKDEGINIELVSPQNEPGYDQNYPSCLWDKTTYVSWLKTLASAMSSLNVKVMLGTLSNAGDGGRSDLDIASAVLADTAAKNAVTVVGVQWGVLDKVNSGQTFGGLPIWASEHKCGNYPWDTANYNKNQAPNDQAYGVESWGYIRDAITKGKVTSYNAWNMVLDKLGLGNDTTRDWKQDALLVADGGSVKTTQAYYVFRHFSQFVTPGAKVVGTSGGDAVAFKNPDGSVVAVMYNSGGAKTNFTVKIGTKYLQFSMPSAGWATVKAMP